MLSCWLGVSATHGDDARHVLVGAEERGERQCAAGGLCSCPARHCSWGPHPPEPNRHPRDLRRRTWTMNIEDEVKGDTWAAGEIKAGRKASRYRRQVPSNLLESPAARPAALRDRSPQRSARCTFHKHSAAGSSYWPGFYIPPALSRIRHGKAFRQKSQRGMRVGNVAEAPRRQASERGWRTARRGSHAPTAPCARGLGACGPG